MAGSSPLVTSTAPTTSCATPATTPVDIGEVVEGEGRVLLKL